MSKRRPALDLQRQLRAQSGVISRSQILALAGTDSDIRRMVRRRELARMVPGVFVNHTGAPTWLQRAWAGVLHYWPAVLSHESAVRFELGSRWRGGGPREPIHVAIDPRRNAVEVPGYRVHRKAHLDRQAVWQASPPRLFIEYALLDLAAAAQPLEAVALFTDAIQTRQVRPQMLRYMLHDLPRVRQRKWLRAVLIDLELGTCSVLEHLYLSSVERAHRLPRAQRQARDRSGDTTVYRDVVYKGHGLIVELDGRAFHDNAAARDRDLSRDLSAAVQGMRTIRLGWRQVHSQPCETAAAIGALLRQAGWQGALRRCGASCSAIRS